MGGRELRAWPQLRGISTQVSPGVGLEGGATGEVAVLKRIFIRAGLSVTLTLFDPFLLAASSFPPQKYPGLDWVLFVEPPLCLCDFRTPQSEGNIIHKLSLGGGHGKLYLSSEEILLPRAELWASFPALRMAMATPSLVSDSLVVAALEDVRWLAACDACGTGSLCS